MTYITLGVVWLAVFAGVFVLGLGLARNADDGRQPLPEQSPPKPFEDHTGTELDLDGLIVSSDDLHLAGLDVHDWDER